jgi:hypothetical protein
MSQVPRHSGKQSSAKIGQSEKGSAVITIDSVSLDSSYPPVNWLKEVDQFDKGFAARYLASFLDEREKITAAEIAHIRHVELTQRRGQLFGLVMGTSGLITAFLISYLANDAVTASIVGGTTVLGLVTVFVTGRIANPKREQHPDATPPPSEPKSHKRIP